MVGLYCRSLAYAQLGKKCAVTKRYGKEYMEVIGKTFSTCALELSEATTDSQKQSRQVWVAWAPVCAVWYISDQQ